MNDIERERLRRAEWHLRQADQLLLKAEEWIEDEATLGERGYGMAQVWIDLAKIHLALRDARGGG